MADDKRLERLEVKVDDINDHLASIDIVLQAQHISLKEHIKRSNKLEEEFKPIHRKIYMFQGVLAFLGILATIVSIIMALR